MIGNIKIQKPEKGLKKILNGIYYNAFFNLIIVLLYMRNFKSFSLLWHKHLE